MGSYITSALQGAGNAVEGAGNALQSTPVGQFATNAIQQGVGPALGQAMQGVGQQTGLGNLASGLKSLFGGGEAGHLADLGQQVPSGVELAGPSSTFTGGAGPGGFMQGMLEGFRGTAGGLGPDVGGATQSGAGLGQFIAFLDQMNQRGAGGDLGPVLSGASLMQPIMRPVTRMATTPYGYHPAEEPRGFLTNILSGITYGILAKPVGANTAAVTGLLPSAGG